MCFNRLSTVVVNAHGMVTGGTRRVAQHGLGGVPRSTSNANHTHVVIELSAIAPPFLECHQLVTHCFPFISASSATSARVHSRAISRARSLLSSETVLT